MNADNNEDYDIRTYTSKPECLVSQQPLAVVEDDYLLLVLFDSDINEIIDSFMNMDDCHNVDNNIVDNNGNDNNIDIDINMDSDIDIDITEDLSMAAIWAIGVDDDDDDGHDDYENFYRTNSGA